MSLNKSFDIGAQIKGYAGIALTSTPIPSSSGGVAQNGAAIDRTALARQYYSCRSIVRARFVALTTVQSVSLALSFQHSSDGTSWDNYSTASNVATVVGPTTAAGAVEGLVEQRVSLVGARRYVRQVMTPTFSTATSGDVLYDQGSIVFGGSDEQPSS
jgi:hypothetical protein